MQIETTHNYEKLIQGITAQDLLVAEAAINGLDNPIRSNIDKRRKLLASLERELMAATSREHVNVFDYYSPVAEIGEFINLWCDQVKKISHQRILLSDPDYCDRIIDCYLPKIWNWDADLLVLVHPATRTVIDKLVERGQKNIVVFLEAEANVDISDIDASTATIFLARNEKELANRFSRLKNRVRHVTTIHCNPGQVDHQEIIDKVDTALKLGRKVSQISINTRARFSNSWARNIIINMPKMAQLGKLTDLKVEGVTHAVVVAPGPSLEKNIHLLKTNQERFFITAPLRAAGVLEKHNVRPDLLFQVDALNETEVEHFRKNMPKNIENLALEGNVSPVFFEIETKNTVWTVMQEIDRFHKAMQSKPTTFRAPSVAMYAAHFCYELGFDSICLLGQDLATDGKTLYASGATKYLAPGGSLDGFDIPVPGFWGEEVLTREDFAYYIEQYCLLTERWKFNNPELQLINSTEGGAFIEGFDHKTFRDHIDQIIADSKHEKKILRFENACPEIKREAENYLTKLGLNLATVKSVSKKIIQLEEPASREQRAAKKREKLIKKFKELAGETELLEVKMQKELTETIGSAYVTSSIPSYSQFFGKVISAADELTAALKLSEQTQKSNYNEDKIS